jgi:hypothetical protein
VQLIQTRKHCSSRVKVHWHGQGRQIAPGHGPLQRRPDHQDPGAHECVRHPRALRAPARAALRRGRRAPLIDGLAFPARIADTAFDTDALRADLDARGAKAVIAQPPGRTTPRGTDGEMSKWRYRIETFCKLKEFKRIALRSDKTDQSFAAMIDLTATVITSR